MNYLYMQIWLIKLIQLNKNLNIKKFIHFITMLLQQFDLFQPTKFAYFPNQENPCIVIHPNLQYIAFSTRTHQLILHNKKTGRTSNIYKSQHGIVDIKFTSNNSAYYFLDDLILMIEKGYHQILIFSLKTEKIKKKITGNRNQILKLSYCRQRGIFAAITNEVCSIYNQFTLNREKVLKCSTSSFIDCHFSPSGQFLFTVFKDSTFFKWNLHDFSYEQYEVQGKKLKIFSNYSAYIGLYNYQNVWLGDLTHQLLFQKLDIFWSNEKIRKVSFLENILIIQTDKKLYLAQVSLAHKFVLKNVKAVEDSITTFKVGGYGSMILLLCNNAKKVSCVNVIDSDKNVIGKPKNPLKNQGIYCSGGYSAQKGCIVQDKFSPLQIQHSDPYNNEALNKNTYNQATMANFSQEKFQQFLSKHHVFPDKHRSAAYKFLLKLPINPEKFIKVEQKGWHECVEYLDEKYPLQNEKLSQIMKNIISWLAHIDPVYGEYEHTAGIVFPFVCLFGKDQYLCFEIVYRMFTNWLSFLFDEFPVANSKFLQNVYEILEETDPQMLRHLRDKNIAFTKLSWGLCGTFFAANLPKQAFLALIDKLVVHPNQPCWIMFMLLGYISYNRSRILTLKNEKDLNVFLEQQHTVNTAKFLKYVYSYEENFRNNVHYKFQNVGFQPKQYVQMSHYPKEAVKMYQGRRKIQAEQYRKIHNEQNYKEKLTKEMQKMTIQAKRNAQREMIQAQSFNYHVENQEKSLKQDNPRHINSSIRVNRIKRLQKLISELTQSLKNQAATSQNYGKSPIQTNSFSTNLYDQSDRQLEQLQLKLMEKLTQLRSICKRPLQSIPVSSFQKDQSGQKSSSLAFKTLMNAEMANKLWQLDSLDNKNEGQKWENQMLRSMKA